MELSFSTIAALSNNLEHVLHFRHLRCHEMPSGPGTYVWEVHQTSLGTSISYLTLTASDM